MTKELTADWWNDGALWQQQSLLEEPAAHLTLRLSAVRGEPGYNVWATISRPDGSWITAHVAAHCTGETEVVGTVARMMGEQFHLLRKIVPPF